MKKLLFTAVSALAMGAAIAADSTQFGVLQVPSSAKETIVSVPWLESGTDNQNISVSNLVLTSGLSVGDQLMYYKGTGYDCWVIAEDSGTKVKYWTPGVNVTSQGANKSAASNAQKIPRGGAVILKRNDPGECFYIMGKPADGSAVTTPLASSPSASVYSLVAPPSVTGAAINAMTWTNIERKDRLALNTATGIKYYGWSRASAATPPVYSWADGETGARDGVIPPGQGVWFISAPTTQTEKQVSWGN